MTDIILSTQNGEPVVSSREVAERFNKNHKDVLRAIENLAAQNCATKSMFYETTFENRGKQYPMYLMNRDGFSLLTFGFTGDEALEWKLKYIFEAVWNEIYEAMERRGFNLELRVSNAKSRAMKNGICKSDVRKISKAKIIESGGKKIICAFVDSVRELAVKAGTRVDKLDEVRQTAFDRNCAPAGRLREGWQHQRKEVES